MRLWLRGLCKLCWWDRPRLCWDRAKLRGDCPRLCWDRARLRLDIAMDCCERESIVLGGSGIGLNERS